MLPHWPLQELVWLVSLPLKGKGWGWGHKDFGNCYIHLNSYIKSMDNLTKEKIDLLDVTKLELILRELEECAICPRNCRANRFSKKLGYCKSDASYFISSICIHRGEEPPVSGPNGICNVFFGHCNLQCVYCQNHQISFNTNPKAARRYSLKEVIGEIVSCLDAGCEAVGFVSPSHFVPQVKVIVNALHELNLYPIIVYNTNGYDKVETLKAIEPMVDVYLPDFKYLDQNLSRKYSDAKDYPGVAIKAFAEMYRQKGSSLITNENGIAERGILIRHLVLPGHAQNSIDVLRFIAEEISTSIHISLMSQYHPTHLVKKISPINRTLVRDEYQNVVDAFHDLGFRNGWIQDLDSYENYKPDFRKKHPFEE
jgi:putative pyruvate formate lyase activating enzyme